MNLYCFGIHWYSSNFSSVESFNLKLKESTALQQDNFWINMFTFFYKAVLDMVN